jgi:hypothetical protein
MDSTDFGETIRMNSAYTAATEYLSSKSEKVDTSDEMDFKVIGGNTQHHSRVRLLLRQHLSAEGLQTADSLQLRGGR